MYFCSTSTNEVLNTCKRLALSFVGNLDNFQNHKDNNKLAYACVVYFPICNKRGVGCCYYL